MIRLVAPSVETLCGANNNGAFAMGKWLINYAYVILSCFGDTVRSRGTGAGVERCGFSVFVLPRSFVIDVCISPRPPLECLQREICETTAQRESPVIIRPTQRSTEESTESCNDAREQRTVGWCIGPKTWRPHGGQGAPRWPCPSHWASSSCCTCASTRAAARTRGQQGHRHTRQGSSTSARSTTSVCARVPEQMAQ